MEMSNSERLLRSLDINKDLVIEFFIFFSRFEYALKGTGYIRGSSKKVEADWDRFAKEIATTFEAEKDIKLEEAVKYLLSNSPKKQILKDRQLDWKDNNQGKRESKIQYLLRLVRTVRNNLFHGAKFPEIFVHEQARDEKLLQSSLFLLKTCLGLKEELKREFFKGV